MAKLYWEAGRKAVVARERGTIRVRPEVVNWARHSDAVAERDLLNRIAHQKVDYGLVRAPLTSEEEERARREAARALAAERAGAGLQTSLRAFRALVVEFQNLAPFRRVTRYPEVLARAQRLHREAYEEGQTEAHQAKRRRVRR
jgi:hypothetical protein